MTKTVQFMIMMVMAAALMTGCASSARIDTVQLSAEKRNSNRIHSPCI